MLEDFVRFRVADPEAKGNSKCTIDAQDLVEMLRTYLK
jgi:hypothetical protein